MGRAIALRLAEAGFDIALTYLTSQDDAQKLSDEIMRLRRTALAIQADLTRPEEAAETIVSAVTGRWDRLDVLVNNASIFELDEPEDALGQLRRMMAIHSESPMLLCNQLEAHLRKASGRIVNMVDLLAERPWPSYSAYSASKSALLSLTRSLARRLAPNVTVNGIAPGVVEWPQGFPEDQRQKYLGRVPLARVGSPQDVASLVHFLATDGSYITGQIIRLDGGRSLT